MIVNLLLSIPHHGSHLFAQNNTPWFTTTGWAWLSMIHHHWYNIAHHDSQTTGSAYLTTIQKPLAQNNTPWFPHTRFSIAQWLTTTGLAWHNMTPTHWAQHNSPWFTPADPGVWESWCVILRQWMGFKVWTLFQWMWIMERVMLCQWLWITMCYSAPVGVNHGELCCGSDCESLSVILCQ
jgi:hypothetical protein